MSHTILPLTCPYYAETSRGVRNMYSGRIVDASKLNTGAARQWKAVNLSGFGSDWNFVDASLNDAANDYLSKVTRIKTPAPLPEAPVVPTVPAPVSQTFTKDHKAAVRELNKKYHNMQELWEILELGLTTGKHVFIYGAGGHAKSSAVADYFRIRGINPFVQSCGDGLTEEKIYGGLNVRKFNQSGEIEYNVHTSFMYHEFVVFEELLDAPVGVLLSLKDVLTSKTLRQGNQQFPIRTKLVICLTNKSKQEVSEDESIIAFLERFPLELKLEWSSYRAGEYFKMFKKLYNGHMDDAMLLEIAQLCEMSNNTNSRVSPRTAVHLVDVVSKGSMKSAKYVSGVNYDAYMKAKKQAQQSVDAQDQYAEIIRLTEMSVTTKEDAEAIYSKLMALTPIHDSNLSQFASSMKKMEDLVSSFADAEVL